MLHARKPLSLVGDTCLIGNLSLSFKFIVNKVTAVVVKEGTVRVNLWYCKISNPILHVLFPLSIIDVAVTESKNASSFLDTTYIVSHVVISLTPLILSLAMREPVLPRPLINIFVIEYFDAISMFFIFVELPLVLACKSLVFPLTLEFATNPLSLVYFTSGSFSHAVATQLGVFPSATDYFVF